MTFVASTIATYACFGLVGTVVADLVRCASWVYAGVALMALVAGAATLIGAAWHQHEHVEEVRARNALSAAFLAGVGFALMVSPCCTPVLGVIIASSSMHGNVLLGVGLLAVFGLGHAAPLLVVLAGGRAAVMRLGAGRWAQGMQVGAGACMMALGAYYALLV
jgi:cytochrome c biogenesis protein CcdA